MVGSYTFCTAPIVGIGFGIVGMYDEVDKGATYDPFAHPAAQALIDTLLHIRTTRPLATIVEEVLYFIALFNTYFTTFTLAGFCLINARCCLAGFGHIHTFSS